MNYFVEEFLEFSDVCDLFFPVYWQSEGVGWRGGGIAIHGQPQVWLFTNEIYY